MTSIVNGIFDLSDRIQMESLNQRMRRSEVITSNISNSETPGFRSISYDFENQLQALSGESDPFPVAVSDPRHFRSEHTEVDGTIYPDVYVTPSESVAHDGNTVDVDGEMAKLAENQIMYQAVTELLNRKIGTLRYAITSGGR